MYRISKCLKNVFHVLHHLPCSYSPFDTLYVPTEAGFHANVNFVFSHCVIATNSCAPFLSRFLTRSGQYLVTISPDTEGKGRSHHSMMATLEICAYPIHWYGPVTSLQVHWMPECISFLLSTLPQNFPFVVPVI